MRQFVLDSSVKPLRNLLWTPLPQPTIASTAQVSGVASTRWFGGSGGNGTYTVISSATSNPFAPRYVRKTWTAAGGTNGDTGFDVNPRTGSGNDARFLVTPGQTITAIGFLRPSVGDKGGKISFYWYDSSGVGLSTSGRTYGNTILMTANVWNQIVGTSVVPDGAAAARIAIDINSTNGAPWAVNDTLDFGAAAAYQGNVPYYYDGNAPGWVWLGPENNSESVGYPTPKNLMSDSDLAYLPSRPPVAHAAEENMGAYYSGQARIVDLGGTDGRVIEVTANDNNGAQPNYGGPIILNRKLLNYSGRWSGMPVVTQGDKYTASCEIMSPTPIAGGCDVGIRYTDANGGYFGEDSSIVDIPSTWTRVSHLSTAGSTAPGSFPNFELYIRKGITGIGNGYVMYVRNVQIEVGSTATPYSAGLQEDGFDGGSGTFGAAETVFARTLDGGSPSDNVFNDIIMDGGSV